LIIERRGRSHRACCVCGWAGHAWNELRPAEADAWHHLFGDDSVVDILTGAERADRGLERPVSVPLDADSGPANSVPESGRRLPSVERLVNRARTLADSPSPYRQQAVSDLWHLAAEDRALVQAAISEIGELLRRHSRRSAGTADSEWLQLITARRLLQEALEQEDTRSFL
jgi:hypothetical protein